MADLSLKNTFEVTQVDRDVNKDGTPGRITRLGGPRKPPSTGYWCECVPQVRTQLDNGFHYSVRDKAGGKHAYVDKLAPDYVRTVKDGNVTNNLDDVTDPCTAACECKAHSAPPKKKK